MVAASPNPAQIPRWMHIVAKVVRLTLYFLLFAVPLSAIVGAWLEGHPLTLLSGIEIPSILAVSHDAGATVANIHNWLGDTILWVAGFHALAGLYHHFVLRDGVLASMLPRSLSFHDSKGD